MICSKGIFWKTDTELVCIKHQCNSNGLILDSSTLLTAKSGQNDNHAQVWSTFHHTVTHGKAYNYYPRGRVEIRHGKASIYLNPHLFTEEFISKIIAEFSLTKKAGITSVTAKADGSQHYRCYLDE